MTFTEIVNSVADRLNLTSAPSITRIGKSVNERYKWLVTSMSLDTASEATKSATCTPGSRFLVFTATLKVLSLYDASTTPNGSPLTQLTVDEMRNRVGLTGKAQAWAPHRMGANTVTLILDATPSVADVWTADAIEQTTTLSGSTAPAFDENFHDVLEFGAMATELKKMEKPALAEECEAMFEKRCAELRLFIAKSAYLDIVQGKTDRRNSWRTRAALV